MIIVGIDLAKKLLSQYKTISTLIPVPYHFFCFILIVFGYGFIFLCLALAFQKAGLVTFDVPYGADYLSFYAASQLILDGTPELIYTKTAHLAAQLGVFPSSFEYIWFFYPPIFMLYCFPMALLPYIYSIVAWLIITFVFCFFILRIYAKGCIDALPLFGFGGTQITFLVGQNAFLTTGLMGAGLMLLKKRPLLAGLCFGLLAYKPHLGIVLPFFLIASGQWRAFFAATFCVSALIALSIGVFGIETWVAFLNNAHSAVAALEESKVGNEKMHSFFGAIRMLGGSLWLAYSVQAFFAILTVASVMRTAYKLRKNVSDMAPLVATAPLLITPFVLAYDMMLLAIPLLWLFQQGRDGGFYIGERGIMALAFLAPMVANTITIHTGIPFMPLIVGSVFLLVLRRLWKIQAFD